MELLTLSADDVRTALPMPKAIEAAEVAFVAQALGQGVTPQRSQLSVAPVGGTSLVMPGYLPGAGLATKIVSFFPGNPDRGLATTSGLVVLLDEQTGAPCALIDGTFLTAWRTGAAGGVAAKWLSHPEARVAAMLGAGAQARTQLMAMDTVRPLEVVRVWSRDGQSARALAESLQPELNARIEVAATVAAALDGAQLVCSATPATEPLFSADMLQRGAHLTSVGSFQPQMVEVDPALAGCARVVVDDRQAALEEAGELIQATAQGLTDPADWVLLGDVVRGEVPGRRDDQEVTWFKSVGLAVQDVAAGGAVLAQARLLGLGKRISF